MRNDDLTVRCHDLLLRLAGAAADELLTQCRHWLAEDRRADLARAVTHAVLAQPLAMLDEDLGLLGELLAEAGADVFGLSIVDVAETDQLRRHAFAPNREQARTTMDPTPGDDPPNGLMPRAGGEPEDDVDRAIVTAVAAAPAALALWRAWRYPADGSPWPQPRRVYLIEARPESDLRALTGRVQRTLEDAGERHPQVETYTVGEDLPVYQRLARAYAALLWTDATTDDDHCSSTPDPGLVAHLEEPAWSYG